MLGEAPLGVYRLAMSLASAPADKIAMLIMRVTGPLFAKVQDDRGLLRRYFLFISDAIALSIFPLVFGLTVVAPEVIGIFLGPKWHGAVAPMQWLAIFMALRTMNALMNQVLTSLRFTAFLLWMSIVSSLVMPASFIVAANWSIAAVAASWIFAAPITLLPPAVKLFREIQSGWREYIGILWPATIGSLVMVLVVMGARRSLIPQQWPIQWRLVIQVVIGGLAYAGVLWTFFRPLVKRYLEFLLRIRRNRGAVAVDV